jgi:hypothetical protein
MNEIIVSEVTELADPKLRAVAQRVYLTLRLAGEKAVAAHAEPTKYPLGADPNSAERLFLARFQELPAARQQAAVAKIMTSVKAPQAQRAATYGDLAQVNLSAATVVAAQVQALPFPAALKFSASHLSDLVSLGDGILHDTGLVPQQTHDKLEFRIHKVKCADETDGLLGTEFGEDDIRLGGTAVDESGDTHKIPAFKVGDFDDGDVKTYSPAKRFTSFNLHEGTTFPKSYCVTLVLAEKDWGGVGAFIDKLYEKVKAKVIEYITKALEGTVGSTIPGLGIIVAWVLRRLVDWIKEWFEDDIFKPVTLVCKVGSLNGTFAGGAISSADRITTFRGHGGKYEVTYDWRLFS